MTSKEYKHNLFRGEKDFTSETNSEQFDINMSDDMHLLYHSTGNPHRETFFFTNDVLLYTNNYFVSNSSLLEK